MKLRHSVVIRRPIAEVFAFVTDLRNETRWQPENRCVTLEGPIEEGAIFREERVTFGRRFAWRFRITRFDPPRAITIETISMSAGALPYRGSRRFVAVAGGTEVIEEGELALPWALRPFAPLLARLSQRPVRQAYARLKGMLEATPELPVRIAARRVAA